MSLERRVAVIAVGAGLLVVGVLVRTPIRGGSSGRDPTVHGDSAFHVAQTLGMLETAQRAHFRARGTYTSDPERAWQYIPSYSRPSVRGDVEIVILAADSAGWNAIGISRERGILCARAGGAGPSALVDSATVEERGRRHGVSFSASCAGSLDGSDAVISRFPPGDTRER